MRPGMHLAAARLGTFALAIGLASCARGASNGSQNTAPISVATMSAHGSVHVALTSPAVTTDFDNGTCTLASPDDDGGGLRITATSSASPGSTIVIVGPSASGDGDITWQPSDTSTRVSSSALVDANLTQGIVFTGSAGSTTTLHIESGGRKGTATLQGATFVSPTTVTDAAGTITWSCS